MNILEKAKQKQEKRKRKNWFENATEKQKKDFCILADAYITGELQSIRTLFETFIEEHPDVKVGRNGFQDQLKKYRENR